MKNQTIKKLTAIIIIMIFSFALVNAQPCNGNKIRVYKCSNGNCHSKCVNPLNIPLGWSTSMAVCLSCSGLGGGGKRVSQNNDIPNETIALTVAPSPLTSSATISFSLGQSENISLRIFDMNGRLVSTLADEVFEEGDNEIMWSAADVNAGIYFLQFQSTENLQTEKLMVSK